MKQDTTITLRLQGALLELIKTEAKDSNKSAGQIIRTILARHYEGK
jgi:predicted DNA binding CopG/RHH family protein